MAKVDEVLPISTALRRIGRPVMFYPAIAKLLGSINAAIFIAPFMWYQDKQYDNEGWIYKTQSEIEFETALSRTEQENARKKLQDLSLLKVERRGVPAKNYYKFDWQMLDQLAARLIEPKPIKTAKQQDEPEAQPVVEPRPDPLLYRAKEAFNKRYEAHYSNAFSWPKAKGGGKEWHNLKLLVERIKESAILHKQRNTESKDKILISDDEIIANLTLFLDLLPEYHLNTSFTPELLYSRYNAIVNDIRATTKTGKVKPVKVVNPEAKNPDSWA